MICFRMNIVGGPFDGARGLAWIDDGEHPPPERIFMGMCGKGRDCGLSICAPGLRHVAYWTADEERPSGCVSYRKENEYVERDDEGPQDRFHGHAVYVIGGLMLPGIQIDEEFVGAGSGGPLVTALADGRHDRGWPRDPYMVGFEAGRVAARRLRERGMTLDAAQLRRLEEVRAQLAEWA